MRGLCGLHLPAMKFNAVAGVNAAHIGTVVDLVTNHRFRVNKRHGTGCRPE
jgi:hypothetical protein